jgi:uncharacterized membrane protein HdeD (DUF308 family)
MGPAAWIALVRGLVAVTLGSAILFYPDKTRPILANFIGLYWLVSGVLCLRWTISGERAGRLSLAAGVIGVLGGLLVLARFLVRGWLTPELLAGLLGATAVLTGALHMAGGFHGADARRRRWSWSSFLLGLFEVVLGIMILLSPLEPRPFLIVAASLWALLGGSILMADAWWLGRESRLRKAQRQPHPTEKDA